MITVFRFRSRSITLVLGLLAFVSAPIQGARAEAGSEPGPARKAVDWFSENFEIHGFLRTRFYTRVPDWDNTPVASSLRSEINLEPELRIFSNEDWNVSFYGVFRPVYEAAFDMSSDIYGRTPTKAAFGTAPSFSLGGGSVDPTIPNNITAFQSRNGDDLFNPNPLIGGLPINSGFQGGQIEGEFTILNADTGSLFTGELTPAVAIDQTVFFGRVTAPWATRGTTQGYVGGNAKGTTYEDLRDNYAVATLPGQPTFQNAGLPLALGLNQSLTTFAGTEGPAPKGLRTPLNYYFKNALGDKKSLEQAPFDVNRKESALKFDCFDNAHPYCMFREFYFDVEYKDTFMRFGRQQIVWGKTDAFRLQDVVNPIDFSFHNVFPDLEERRIPVLALDVIHSFGSVGPVEDVSLEVAWVWDRFIADQFGQCGEPWAFAAACEGRADAGGHQLFNFSLANVDERKWKFTNTQPGLRLEFRTPEPSIAFSVSAFYGFQKLPVADFRNRYSVQNPNPAAMLFLQGITFPDGTPVAGAIDQLVGSPGVGNNPWLDGFDPYAKNPDGTPIPGSSLDVANQFLIGAWDTLINNPAAVPLGGCANATTEEELEVCIGNNAALALPWTASEATLKYPRVWSLGASMDYQIPGIDTVLRAELASDIGRGIQDTDRTDGWTKRDTFKAAIGIDRSTFIPFLNPNRTAFLSFQTFIEHIVDYNRGDSSVSGMVPFETNVISTFFMQNFWRNDSIVLTNLLAVDWNAHAVIWGPFVKWVFNQNLFFEFGMNFIWGDNSQHNIRDLCPNGRLNNNAAASCSVRNPSSWNDGQWTLLNGPAQRSADAPFGWARQSFADQFMRRRDEFWVGVTYQF